MNHSGDLLCVEEAVSEVTEVSCMQQSCIVMGQDRDLGL